MSARGLDKRDLCAVVAEEHRSERAGKRAAEIEYTKTGAWAYSHRCTAQRGDMRREARM